MPFMRSYIPSARRSRLPSMPRAGYLLGTTRTDQPGLSRSPWPLRCARISGGVLLSLPGLNGQNPPLRTTLWRMKSVGLRARSVAIMTQRPVTGSYLSSGNSVLSGGWRFHFMTYEKLPGTVLFRQEHYFRGTRSLHQSGIEAPSLEHVHIAAGIRGQVRIRSFSSHRQLPPQLP